MDIEGTGGRDSERLRGLRARLLGPLLHAILLAAAPLRDSPEVQGAACLFIRTHHHTLRSILHDAASPGNRLWEPGTQELRLATLVLQLLTQVAWRASTPLPPPPPPGVLVNGDSSFGDQPCPLLPQVGTDEEYLPLRCSRPFPGTTGHKHRLLALELAQYPIATPGAHFHNFMEIGRHVLPA